VVLTNQGRALPASFAPIGAGGGFHGRFPLGRHALREAGARCTKWADFVDLKTGYPPLRIRPPSPSRHIYNSLTIAVAFRYLLAFDRVWQHLIKVDGTFA
jgi:hypothetical protein